MSKVAPAVLVMARAPRRGEVRRALEPLLGVNRCLALQAALIKHTVEWANLLEPRAVYLAHEPADAGTSLRGLVGPDVALFPQNGDGISGRLADAVARVSARGPGPIVIVWPDLPTLGEAHASAIISDFADGVDVILGPVCDGGYYAIAIARPLPMLFRLPEQIWRAPDSLGAVISAANESDLLVGLLRPERALHRLADARAALADPLLPPIMAKALGREPIESQDAFPTA